MSLISDLFIATLLFNGLILLTYSLQRHPSLREWRWVVFLLGLAWLGWAAIADLVTIEFFGLSPNDANFHEHRGRAIAEAIWHGGDINEYFRLGNPAYQLWLGLIFAALDCSRVAINMINAFFGFWGSLLLLATIAHRVPEARVPGWLLVLVLMLPTAVFWSSSNIKEGIMYWGIAQLLAMPLLYRRITSLGAIGVLALLLFRPHIAMLWIVALAGALIVTPRYRIFGLIAIIGAFGTLNVLGDYLGREVRGFEDVQQELDKNYAAIVRSGGSAVEYADGRPIPVVSGALMLFLRPFPWEVASFAMVLSMVEIYILTFLIVLLWHRRGRFLSHLRSRPELLIAAAACLLFFVMYSYMGNLGLMSRQRLQAMPALLTLMAIPALLNCTRTPQAIGYAVRPANSSAYAGSP